MASGGCSFVFMSSLKFHQDKNTIRPYFSFQILSRTKPAAGPAGQSTPAKEKGKQKQMPKLEDFLDSRDYTGAITFLEVCET